jgi:hypothetical protein
MSGKFDSYRKRAEAMGDDAKQRWLAAGESHSAVGFAEALYARDKVSFGSVLGSAIALRLFLFVIPANVTVIALTQVFKFSHVFEESFKDSVTTGPMASALLGVSRTQALGIFLSGLVLTAWTGRSLARVLAASCGSSWGLTLTQAKQRMKSMGALVLVVFGAVGANVVFSAVRDDSGVAVSFMVVVAVAATFAAAWFVVLLTLPRDTTDPGALIPGAVLFGVGFALLNWFMQYYLPARVARTSDTLGQMATTVAILGNFFFIGRLMSSSFVLAAVTFERYGSVSHVVFGLPLVRRIPERSQKVRTYFALDHERSTESPPVSTEPVELVLPLLPDDERPAE